MAEVNPKERGGNDRQQDQVGTAEQSQERGAEASSGSQPEEAPLPPASFEFLVLSLRMQARAHLGLLQLGDEPPQSPNLPLARHTIDLLAVLEEKTRGNLTREEERLLQNTLTELRFLYVQVAEQSARH